MDAWAHRWVQYETDGRAHMGTTSMNDSGAMVALYSLTKAGRADWNRAVLLRTASNFDRQPAGMTAEQSANSERRAEFTGYDARLKRPMRSAVVWHSRFVGTGAAGSGRWNERRSYRRTGLSFAQDDSFEI
jgi:Purine nucleoside permease (NUP)